MLPLDDEKWKSLTTFFGESEDLPAVIKKWLKAIGTDREVTIYSDDLFDLFLHQVTITNAAFAVVPWLVHVCKEGVTEFRIEYLNRYRLGRSKQTQIWGILQSSRNRNISRVVDVGLSAGNCRISQIN